MAVLMAFYYSILACSILGVCIQLVLIGTHKLLKKHFFQIIFNFFICNLLMSLSLTIQFIDFDEIIDENSLLCQLQGFTMIYFELGQFFWSSIISHSITVNVINADHSSQESISIKAIYYIIGYLGPLVLVLFIYFFDFIGDAGHYCWISTITEDLRHEIILAIYFTVVWVTIIYNIVTVIKFIRFMRQEFDKDEEFKQVVKPYKTSLLIYPVASLVIVLPATIYRLLSYFIYLESYAFSVIFTLLVCTQGIWYSIGYGLNNEISSIAKSCFMQFICCKEEISSSTVPPSETVTRTVNSNKNSFARNYSEKKRKEDSFIADDYYSCEPENDLLESDKYSLSSENQLKTRFVADKNNE